jgi:hypothetical protein
MMTHHPQIGAACEDWLEEENLLTEVNEIAIREVIAWQLHQEIRTKGMIETTVSADNNRVWIAIESSITLTRSMSIFAIESIEIE